MKRYLLISLAVAVCVALTAPAFAVTSLNGPLPDGGPAVTTSIGSATFQPSTNVYVIICSSSVLYTASSQNASAKSNDAGRQFQATNVSAIQWLKSTSTDNPTACGTAGTAITGGWKNL